MPVNLDEIKALPDEEKLKIINALWESMEEGWEPEEGEEAPELLVLLDERLQKKESGESKFYTPEEVKYRLEKKVEEVRKAKNESDNLYPQ